MYCRGLKKIGIDALALGIISVISITQVVNAAEIEKKAFVDDTKIVNKTYSNGDTTMCPVREVAEKLGLEVKWDDNEKSCLIGSDEANSIKFYIGKDVYIYGKDAIIELGVAPEIKDGHSYVPAKFFKECLDFNVIEDEETVKISSEFAQLKENETVKVKKGEIFEVTLESNESTGYTWNCEKDDRIKLVDTKTIASGKEGMVGAPNKVTNKYMCEESGEYIIKFIYERSFEENSAAKTVEYKIVVE